MFMDTANSVPACFYKDRCKALYLNISIEGLAHPLLNRYIYASKAFKMSSKEFKKWNKLK
ncbi:MAG: hypothetical protein EBT78_02800 [Betaproteobacteria bacterium]|nr:hypothetical protein [Betaproteobacteria bacterium]